MLCIQSTVKRELNLPQSSSHINHTAAVSAAIIASSSSIAITVITVAINISSSSSSDSSKLVTELTPALLPAVTRLLLYC
jgi:hypothetical protein